MQEVYERYARNKHLRLRMRLATIHFLGRARCDSPLLLAPQHDAAIQKEASSYLTRRSYDFMHEDAHLRLRFWFDQGKRQAALADSH